MAGDGSATAVAVGMSEGFRARVRGVQVRAVRSQRSKRQPGDPASRKKGL